MVSDGPATVVVKSRVQVTHGIKESEIEKHVDEEENVIQEHKTYKQRLQLIGMQFCRVVVGGRTIVKCSENGHRSSLQILLP